MSNASPQKQSPAKTNSGKDVTCNVVLLDGENLQISLDKNDIGRVLFDKVCEHLDLIEKDYFGFTYQDDRGPTNLKYWLNLDKKVSKQKKRGAWVFDFAVKFYPPDPSQLRESLTRWLIVLQVRRDLLSGRIPCTFTTYAILGSYNVQADVGEYDPSDHGNSYDYIRNMTFSPNQTPELLEKIAELHKQHKGQTPDEAEKAFLDNAKKLAMYGVDLHKAKDADNNAVMLGVCCSGLLIYRDKLRVNRFVWPKIIKLSYKRNHFYIKIRPGELEKGEATVMFKLDNHRLAKRLWKTCVEHHAFFRLRESEKPSNNVSFPRFGSKFRYSGRTLYQTRQNAALLDRPAPYFERSQPDRRSASMSELDRDKRGDYEPNKSRTLDRDGRDRGDRMDGQNAYGQGGRGLDSRSDDDGTLQRRPYGDDSMDRRDRVPSQGDATLEREKARGNDDSMGVLAGNLEGPDGKKETDKERRKREKEEDKKRKEEEKKKKKKGKDLDPSEDRMDKKDANDSTLNAAAPGEGLAGLEGAGRLYVPKQYLYNKDGKPYDRQSNGILVDPDRKPYPANAYLYDKNGTPFDGNRYLYDKDGRPYDKDNKGNLYDKDGRPYDGNDDLYDKYGRPYGRDSKGNLYELDGTAYNGQGFLFDKEGRPYDGNGVLYDDGGQPYDGKGYLYDQYGRPYDGYGEPFYKDSRGNLYDMDGRPYDGKNYLYDPYGRPYDRDANGNLFDKDGKPYDGKEYLYDRNGKPYDGNKYLYDKYGRPYDRDGKGNLIDQDGKPYDGKSDLYDKYGRPYERDSKGNLYDRDGKPYDPRGFLYDKDGRPYAGKGSTHDDDGKPYDAKGYLFDKDGRPYDGIGEPYYKDSKGNLYTLDGVPYDGRRNLYDKEGRPYDRDSRGNLYDQDGRPFDGKGFLYDERGRPYDGRRNLYDKDGRPYGRDNKGNLYDKDGKPYDGKDSLYDKYGRPYERDSEGNLYEHDGRPFDDRPFLFDKDGKPYNGVGVPYDEDGRPFDSRGYLFDKDKNPYNGNGYPYYMDGQGNLYDTEGMPYDGSRDLFDKYGRPYGRDKKGNLIDRDGKPYDGKGYLYDDYGKPYDGNKNLYDKYGRPYDRDNKGNLYDKDGRPYDGKSDLYDKHGRPYERDSKGNLYDQDGRPFDGRGLLYDKAGKPYTGTGNPYDDAGKSYDGKGYLYDKDRKPYNFKGYPFYMDSKGNLYDLDGRPYDPSRDSQDARDKKKAWRMKGSDTPDKGGLHRDDVPDAMQQQIQGGLLGAAPGGAYPYGTGLGVGKGDMTGVVGDEQEIDNYQTFAPIPKPIKETKDSLKSGYSDNMMPFFSPAATSTVGRGKVPPPVPPKGNHSMDDSFNYKTEKDGMEQTRVVQKVVMSGEEDSEFDFDAALADAIRSVTEFNPDMSVERIECVQQIEDVNDRQ